LCSTALFNNRIVAFEFFQSETLTTQKLELIKLSLLDNLVEETRVLKAETDNNSTRVRRNDVEKGIKAGLKNLSQKICFLFM
jgi:hypothetical protein